MSTPRHPGDRAAHILLWMLALVFPLGALLQPSCWPSRSEWPPVSRRLNAPVLLVTVDGLRADRVHHLGGARAVTPVLDELAEHGVSFPLMFASSNEGASSLAALFTARCPGRGADRPFDTLAERLSARGYATAAFVSDGDLAASALARGFDLFDARPGATADELVAAVTAAWPAVLDRPWFVWLHLTDLRPPYGGAATDPRTLDPTAPPDFGSRHADYDLSPSDRRARGWTERESAWLDARYDAALQRVDSSLGELVRPLRAAGRLEMLTVCVTGTYAERLGEGAGPLFTRSVDLLDDALRVPLVLRLPAQTSRGMRPLRLASSLDVGVTLFDITAQQGWPGAVGRSLRPVLLGNNEVNRYVFATGPVRDGDGSAPWLGTVVRSQTTSLLLDATGAPRGAWRLDQDPRQTERLSVLPLHAREFLKGFDQAAPEQAACIPRPR